MDSIPRLAYRFGAPALLRTALTHRSAGRDNNERLEFLGDSVLSAVVSRALYERFPRAPEGVLTRLRAELVREGTLAAIALATMPSPFARNSRANSTIRIAFFAPRPTSSTRPTCVKTLFSNPRR